MTTQGPKTSYSRAIDHDASGTYVLANVSDPVDLDKAHEAQDELVRGILANPHPDTIHPDPTHPDIAHTDTAQDTLALIHNTVGQEIDLFELGAEYCSQAEMEPIYPQPNDQLAPQLLRQDVPSSGAVPRETLTEQSLREKNPTNRLSRSQSCNQNLNKHHQKRKKKMAYDFSKSHSERTSEDESTLTRSKTVPGTERNTSQPDGGRDRANSRRENTRNQRTEHGVLAPSFRVPSNQSATGSGGTAGTTNQSITAQNSKSVGRPSSRLDHNNLIHNKIGESSNESRPSINELGKTRNSLDEENTRSREGATLTPILPVDMPESNIQDMNRAEAIFQSEANLHDTNLDNLYAKRQMLIEDIQKGGGTFEHQEQWKQDLAYTEKEISHYQSKSKISGRQAVHVIDQNNNKASIAGSSYQSEQIYHKENLLAMNPRKRFPTAQSTSFRNSTGHHSIGSNEVFLNNYHQDLGLNQQPTLPLPQSIVTPTKISKNTSRKSNGGRQRGRTGSSRSRNNSLNSYSTSAAEHARQRGLNNNIARRARREQSRRESYQTPGGQSSVAYSESTAESQRSLGSLQRQANFERELSEKLNQLKLNEAELREKDAQILELQAKNKENSEIQRRVAMEMRREDLETQFNENEDRQRMSMEIERRENDRLIEIDDAFSERRRTFEQVDRPKDSHANSINCSRIMPRPKFINNMPPITEKSRESRSPEQETVVERYPSASVNRQLNSTENIYFPNPTVDEERIAINDQFSNIGVPASHTGNTPLNTGAQRFRQTSYLVKPLQSTQINKPEPIPTGIPAQPVIRNLSQVETQQRVSNSPNYDPMIPSPVGHRPTESHNPVDKSPGLLHVPANNRSGHSQLASANNQEEFAYPANIRPGQSQASANNGPEHNYMPTSSYPENNRVLANTRPVSDYFPANIRQAQRQASVNNGPEHSYRPDNNRPGQHQFPDNNRPGQHQTHMNQSNPRSNATSGQVTAPYQQIDRRSIDPNGYSDPISQVGPLSREQVILPEGRMSEGHLPSNAAHQGTNWNGEESRRGPDSHLNRPTQGRQAQTPHVSFSNQNVYHSNDQCGDQSRGIPSNHTSQPDVINVDTTSERSRDVPITTPPMRESTEPASARGNQNSISSSTSGQNEVNQAFIQTLTAMASRLEDIQNATAVDEVPSGRSSRGGMTIRGKYYKSCRDEIIGNKSTRFDYNQNPDNTSLPTILFNEIERRITDFNYNPDDILLLIGKVFDKRLRGEAEAREVMEKILKYTDLEGRTKKKDLLNFEVRKQVYIGLIEFFLGKKEIEIPKMRNNDQLPDLYYNIKLSLELGKFTSNMTRQQRDIEVLDRLEDQSNGLINSESLRKRLINYADNANIRERLEDGEEVDFEKFLKKVQKAEDKDSKNKSRSIPINLCQWDDTDNKLQSQPMVYVPVNQINTEHSPKGWSGGSQQNQHSGNTNNTYPKNKGRVRGDHETGYIPKPRNQKQTAPAVTPNQPPPAQVTAQEPKQKKEPGSLFVGNVDFKATDEQLAEVFREFGTVGKAYISINKETNRSRGFGHVRFLNGDDDAVKRCLERHSKDPIKMLDRTLNIDRANLRPQNNNNRPGSRTGSGTTGGIMNGIKLNDENSMMTSEGRYYYIGRGIDYDDVGVNCLFPNGRICKAQLDSCCFPDGAINFDLVRELGLENLLQDKVTPIIAANDQKFKATKVLKCEVQIGVSVMEVELVVCHTGSNDTFLAGLPMMDRIEISRKMREECLKLDEELEMSLRCSKNFSEGAKSQ